jgi:hypothetical protein
MQKLHTARTSLRSSLRYLTPSESLVQVVSGLIMANGVLAKLMPRFPELTARAMQPERAGFRRR